MSRSEKHKLALARCGVNRDARFSLPGACIRRLVSLSMEGVLALLRLGVGLVCGLTLAIGSGWTSEAWAKKPPSEEEPSTALKPFDGVAGINVFFAAGLTKGEQSRFVETLRTSLEGHWIHAISIGEEDLRLGEGGLPDYCPESPPCLRELAARLKVDRLVLLLLTGGPATVLAEAIVADGASGFVLYRTRRAIPRDQLGNPGAVTPLADAVAMPPLSKLRVSTLLTGAEVVVAGTLVGRAPLAGPVMVSPGGIDVLIRHEGTEHRKRVWVPGGGEEEVFIAGDAAAAAPKRSIAKSPWLWLGIGAGLVVGGAVGVVLGALVIK